MVVHRCTLWYRFGIALVLQFQAWNTALGIWQYLVISTVLVPELFTATTPLVFRGGQKCCDYLDNLRANTQSNWRVYKVASIVAQPMDTWRAERAHNRFCCNIKTNKTNSEVQYLRTMWT